MSGDQKTNPGTLCIINGKMYWPTCAEWPYESIVSLADMTGTPSVTWKVRGTNDGGTLAPGQKVVVREGLVINVAHTGNA